MDENNGAAGIIDSLISRRPEVPAGGRPGASEPQDVITRYPGMQSARERRVVAGAAMPACSITPPKFVARSIRIDNLSGQWLQLGVVENEFIPPYTIGRVINVRGLGVITITPAAPQGVAQIAAVAGDFYDVTIYDKPQLPAYGQSVGVAATGAAPRVIPTAAAILANARINPPVTSAWELISVQASYVCTATVGARNPTMELFDAAGNVILTLVDNAAGITAGVTRAITFAQGGTPLAVSGAPFSRDVVNLPRSPYVPAGGSIRFRDGAAIDANDTIATVAELKPYTP